MSNRLRSIAVLAAGIIIGAVITAHDAFPTAFAQTESQPAKAPAKQAEAPNNIPIHEAYQRPIFPATDDPEVARLYATAYIVGEALRAGVFSKPTDVRTEDRVDNLVRSVYKELGGK